MATAVQFPVPELAEATGIEWQDVQDVPCRLVAETPVRGFSVRDLLLLQIGSIVNSKEKARGSIGLHANGSFIARAEFEVVNGRLGVRLGKSRMKKNITMSSTDAGDTRLSEPTESPKSMGEALWSRITAAFSKVTIHRHSRELKICETLSLGDKRLLALIECGQQRFLIAATSHNISLLRALDAEKVGDENPDLT